MEKIDNAGYDEPEGDFKFDWCDKGALADCKRQKGDVCWAFVTMATIEAINQIATKKMITLSEQHLIDCDYFNKGFCTGSPLKAFKFITAKKGSVYKESEYKFIGKKGNCKCKKFAQIEYKLNI
ncbi:chymomexicain-like [Helianthus annuus]|uniref:chymomexicain-like n=1 Tax=Helianthus annuus TaxID=4232 RepID=UPI000B8FA60E|nr:chymomexicain-like [Helianthus annuus]